MNLINGLLTTFADEVKEGCVSTALFGEVCDSCNGSATMQILAYVLRIMTYGVGILAVIGLLVFGVKYLTAHDNEALAQKARRHLFEVLIGIASYIVLVSITGWLLPGNLTTTMLGGNPGSCPEKTPTDISVIGGDTGGGGSGETGDTTSGDTSSGWSTGNRPRECGPGTPGDFQTLTKNGVTVNGKKYWLYTNSVGRTYPQYAQGSGPWAGKNTKRDGSGCCTIARAGCMITSRAMMNMSYSSGKTYVPEPSGDNIVDKNIGRPGSTSCKNNTDCPFTKIKSIIDQGGTVLVHITGHGWCTTTYGGECTHWFLIVDYRLKNGQPEYFALNTGSSVSEKSKWDGKGGTGWGKFGKSNIKKQKKHLP